MIHHLSEVGFGRGTRIVSAAAGSVHSMALAADGSLFTWGDGRYGQLGHAHMQQVAAVAGANQVCAVWGRMAVTS